MKLRALTIGVGALAFATVGCSSADEPTDDNRSYFIDGYEEISAVSPPTDDTICNYGIASSAGVSGVGANQVVPGTHYWEGFRPGEDTPSFINVAEFFDCDGSRGIDAVVFDTSQYG